jgi:serine phosphatase RsbU (regulator of sigma subunit)
VNGEPLGVIHLDTQNTFNQFRKDDLDLLMADAGQAALSKDTARLLTAYLEKQKQDREMQIARNVQRALLPEQLPQVDGYEFYALYDAAQAVGGDYYDSLILCDGRVCLAFGDVAGKGVPASLVMSRLSSVVQNTVQFVEDPVAAAGRINNQMCAKAVEGRFVTFVMVFIDPRTNQMALINAGHMPLMIRTPDGRVEEFGQETVGLPLGVMEDYAFEVARRTIAPGELAVIYTDGVSEAMNPDGELYGIERLREFLQKTPSRQAAETCQAVLDDVRRHAAGRPQNDDITLMVFGRNAD